MEGKNLIEEIAKCVPVATNEYSGSFDSDGLRTKTGNEQWHREYDQRYKGHFFQDFLHGKGTYSWNVPNDRVVYEGLFHANDLEGYGKFSYSDSSIFEGLFKKNRRFGPGVFTYPDGSQNVGMWYGKNLMRLCCVVKPEWVPRLAKTPAAKVKLLKFKKLVSISNIQKDKAKAILESLEVNEDVMKQWSKLYNIYIRNPKSHFFNTALYDDQYFCKEDCYIDVLSPDEKKACKEKRMEEKLLQVQPSSSIANDPFPVTTNNECVCEDPKQIRLNNIKSELQHTEEVLTRIKNEIKKAQFQRKLAMRKFNSAAEIRKSVGWEKIQIINVDSTSKTNLSEKIPYKSEDEFGSDDGILEEEFELEEGEEIDLDAACKLLAAARSAEKLLLRKKTDLMAKLVYETTNLEKCESNAELPPTEKVLITDLLAWNNEEMSIEMLKHVFLHRKFEEEMSYCVADLLVGDRSKFRNSGVYEEECISFLEYCSDGNVRKATNLLHKYDLNPDLCDARGNAGIIYAAARDKAKMIHALVNFGANVDIFNDECLTPLGMCVARYLAAQLHVTEWGEAFLKATSIGTEAEREIHEWRPHVSLSSINNYLQPQTENFPENIGRQSWQSSHLTLEILTEFLGSNLDVSHFVGSLSEIYHTLHKQKPSHDFQEPYLPKNTVEILQPYILNTECTRPQPEKEKNKEKKVKKDKKTKPSKTSKKSDGSKKNDKSSQSFKKLPLVDVDNELMNEKINEEAVRNSRLNVIYITIETLLRYGANPNACEVPVPTLILAIFTKNLTLIEDLLRCKADANVTTLDEKLTALHVLVSLPPCQELVEILKLLLKYAADPNCQASTNHWVEQKMELVAERSLEDEDEGKTPLHLLSMRYDFVLDTNNYLNQMIPILMEHGGKVKIRYLGHTPLSLAIIRGNLKLVRTFLDTKRISPNQPLGEKMGLPLTVFILKRYKNILPDVNICQDIIHLLLEYKGNPFETIEDYGNGIEFMIAEHEEPPKVEKQEKGKKDKGKKDKEKKKGKVKSKSSTKKKEEVKSKSSGSKKSSKNGKKDKKDKGKQVQEEVKKLLTTAAKIVLERHIKGYAVKYLYFFVEEEDFYDDVSANMAKFVTPEETLRIAQILVHRGEIPLDKSNRYEILYDLIEFIINVNSKSENSEEPASAHVDIHKMLEGFEFSKIPKEQGKLNLPEPEAEQHSEKYNVCFHCYRKKNRQLFICPNCNLIYFCSQQCNILNNKEANLVHKCGTLFYDKQKQIHEERLARGCHWLRTSEYRRMLPELAAQKGWVQDVSVSEICQKRHVEADPKRRLHLTRDFKCCTRKRSRKKNTGNEKLELAGPSDVGLTKQSEGVVSLPPNTKRPLENEHPVAVWKTGACNVDMEKEGVKKQSRGKHQEGFEQNLEKELEVGRNDRKEDSRGREQVILPKGKKGGVRNVTKSTLNGEDQKEHVKIVKYGYGVKTEGRKDGGKELVKLADTSLGKVTEIEGVDLKTRIVGYATTPTKENILELERRLPSKYQYFLEKVSEYWPCFDLSMLFLPYACYSDGQLYYRFLSKEPVFMHTRSIS